MHTNLVGIKEIMKFSTKAEYGLRAIVSLAKSYPARKSLKEISKEEEVSMKYLENIFIILKKEKLVISTKGKYGGYALSRNPKRMTAGEVIEALEGAITATKCIETKCSAYCSCSSKTVWIKLGEQIRKTLYGIKLSDLI